MTSPNQSPGRVVAAAAVASLRRAGYCDEAIAALLQSDEERFGKLSSGAARFRDDELELIEYATGRTAYDWALAGTFGEVHQHPVAPRATKERPPQVDAAPDGQVATVEVR